MRYTTWLQDHSELDDSLATIISDMVSEHGKTCVSIIVPTHRLGQNRQQDIKEVIKAIADAKRDLPYESSNLLVAIDELFQQVDFANNKEGIGFFISPHLKKLVKFPFPVSRKVVVNKFFDLHDLIYIDNYRVGYYVLDISKNEARLFRGIMDHLHEVRDDHFPQHFSDQFEYSKPSQSSSDAGYAHTKGFEKDKSEIQHRRLEKSLRECDKALHSHLSTRDIPLIVCGTQRNIAGFRSVTRHSANMVSTLSDNYSHTEHHDLGILAWTQIRSFIDEQKMKLVAEFREELGMGRAICGVEAVSKAVKEWSAFELLVEKDFSLMDFAQEKNEGYSDVINEIVAEVIKKKGRVVMMEKGSLADFKRIGLITRFRI